MTIVVLSNSARKNLMALGDSKQAKCLKRALDEIAVSPLAYANTTSLTHIPNGYRRRVGRYRILYTFHAEENTVRVWIIDMEKSTRKDDSRWMEYILRQL